MTTIEPGIYRDGRGFQVRATIGSWPHHRTLRKRFPGTTPITDLRAWRLRALARLQSLTPGKHGTLGADVVEYLRLADITPATKKRRTQQLAWWCAQPVAGEVLSVTQVQAEAEARLAGRAVPRRSTLAALRRQALDPKRLREILRVAFAPADALRDPTEHANTSNAYRTALFHLFTTLDQDDAEAVNPLRKVRVRPQAHAQPSGQDARIIAEILTHVPSKYGKSSQVSERRLAVLAWVHLTPTQLMGVQPARDFHDVPDATREDMIAGEITLTKRPRLKGRKNRPIPAPETIPLNPWGVDALRAFAACPAAHGPFSMSPLNKVLKRAASRAQVALAAQGVLVDLSAMTLYHLKHSLATTASLASAGLLNRRGQIVQSIGVQLALDHAHGRSTATYTQAAVDPIVRQVNAATSRYLDRLFQTSLRPEPTLKLVRHEAGHGVGMHVESTSENIE